MSSRQSAMSGLISLIGAVACAFIAQELWADLTLKTRFFPNVPRPVKVLGLIVFAFWCVLETRKVHSRVLEVLEPA